MMKTPNKHHTQAGITLIETLLVVGLLAGILLVLSVMLQDFARREHMRSVAGQMALVQRAIVESFSNVSAFSELHRVALENGGTAEISLLNPDNPNRSLSTSYMPTGSISLESGDGADLRANHIVNAGYNPAGAPTYSAFRDTLPVRASTYMESYNGAGNPREEARVSVLVRASGTAPARALEILIVTVDRLYEKDIRSIAESVGAHGGFVSAAAPASPADCPASGCAYTARSAFGTWSVPLSRFAGTPWYDTIATTYPAVLNDDESEGYLVSYVYINESVIAGDYLYRKYTGNNPDLNRMHTSLDLGRNDIVGADNLEIKNSDGYALTVNRALHAQGSAYIGGNLAVEGDLLANGDIQAGDIKVGPRSGVVPGAARNTGNIVVGNKFKTGYLHATRNVTVAGPADFKNVIAGEAITNNLYTSRLNDPGADGQIIVGQMAYGGDVAVTEELKASQIETSSMTAQSTGIVQGEMSSELTGHPGSYVPSGSLRIDGSLNVSGGKVLAQDGILIRNLIRCESGC
jgi:type II secretory pathway pseudopilin PulG